jgi:hypothetical protein
MIDGMIPKEIAIALLKDGFTPIEDSQKTYEDKRAGYQVFKWLQTVTRGNRKSMGILKVGVVADNSYGSKKGSMLVRTCYGLENKIGRAHV